MISELLTAQARRAYVRARADQAAPTMDPCDLPVFKARALFRKIIPCKEWYRFRLKHYILVRGNKGGIYRIKHKSAFNVEQLKPRKRKLCAVPESDNLFSELPIFDQMAAQYLALKNDEDYFLSVANDDSPVAGEFPIPAPPPEPRVEDRQRPPPEWQQYEAQYQRRTFIDFVEGNSCPRHRPRVYDDFARLEQDHGQLVNWNLLHRYSEPRRTYFHMGLTFNDGERVHFTFP